MKFLLAMIMYGTVLCRSSVETVGWTGSTSSDLTIGSVCGDNVLSTGESCDNGNQLGCSSNCVPDTGYTCTGSLGQTSSCKTTCGDSVRSST